MPEAVDFTCRNFVPNMGIDEDVATGSIQVPLNAYWTRKLGKAANDPLTCLQVEYVDPLVQTQTSARPHGLSVTHDQ